MRCNYEKKTASEEVPLFTKCFFFLKNCGSTFFFRNFNFFFEDFTYDASPFTETKRTLHVSMLWKI